jgi:undecaprenyl-diphosphatase
MQLAALAAVISYFWRDVWDIVSGSLSAIARRDYYDRSFGLAVGIVIGTIPIGLAGLALAKTLNTCGSPLRSLVVVGLACIVMALLLAIAEVAARHQRPFERVGLLDCDPRAATPAALVPRACPRLSQPPVSVSYLHLTSRLPFLLSA